MKIKKNESKKLKNKETKKKKNKEDINVINKKKRHTLVSTLIISFFIILFLCYATIFISLNNKINNLEEHYIENSINKV